MAIAQPCRITATDFNMLYRGCPDLGETLRVRRCEKVYYALTSKLRGRATEIGLIDACGAGDSGRSRAVGFFQVFVSQPAADECLFRGGVINEHVATLLLSFAKPLDGPTGLCRAWRVVRAESANCQLISSFVLPLSLFSPVSASYTVPPNH